MAASFVAYVPVTAYTDEDHPITPNHEHPYPPDYFGHRAHSNINSVLSSVLSNTNTILSTNPTTISTPTGHRTHPNITTILTTTAITPPIHRTTHLLPTSNVSPHPTAPPPTPIFSPTRLIATHVFSTAPNVFATDMLPRAAVVAGESVVASAAVFVKLVEVVFGTSTVSAAGTAAPGEEEEAGVGDGV
ncbi:uncharacterized protein LAJ45_03707 [Morchella importuna]|uniref:uncharacterized protein n=1 Tax=Morchella importuna TaxID=1174673 RepID=UPI001E8DB8D7|nr:uncharacterized protein LAJ45_03707 [Morchella importuna]KAH8152280.1 hypothetical protein LAJ45_03707 [Morchella importuna]